MTCIARQIANVANQELPDPKRIEAALLMFERQLEVGLIDEPAFEAKEARLLEELAEISALREAETRAASGRDDAESVTVAEQDHLDLPMPEAEGQEAGVQDIAA